MEGEQYEKFKKPLNEQKVLDKLGIDDFRHLSKER